MARYMVIAARKRSDLYSYLKRQFTEDDEAQVLFDRRHEERRRREETHESERRRGERRSRRGKDPGLDYHGFLVMRQVSVAPETKIQWRPPWWESGRPGEPVGLERRRWPGETHAMESQERMTVGILEGEHLLTSGSKLLVEHEQVTARAETAERKCERLEEEIRNLKTEIEHFKRERRQFAETLKTLARHLAQSAGGTS